MKDAAIFAAMIAVFCLQGLIAGHDVQQCLKRGGTEAQCLRDFAR
jgi:hypothetical protein